MRGGVFRFSDGVTLSITDSWFDTSEATKSGGIMFYDNKPGWTGYTPTVSFATTKITNSKSRMEAGGFYINNPYITNFDLTTVIIDSISALDGNGGVFLIESLGGTF